MLNKFFDIQTEIRFSSNSSLCRAQVQFELPLNKNLNKIIDHLQKQKDLKHFLNSSG